MKDKEKNMKLIRNTVNLAADALIAAGILLLILRLQGIHPYIVLSGSMEPEIPAGGVVFTDTGKKDPSVGQIITYRMGDQTVTHRIIRKKEDTYITKGDANKREDLAPVSASQITGTVLFSLPYLGILFSRLQSASPAYLILLMIILSLFLDIRKTSPKFRHKKEFSGREEVCHAKK